MYNTMDDQHSYNAAGFKSASYQSRKDSLRRHRVVGTVPMAPSKLRQAIGAVKDQTSIGLAKVGSNSVADLNIAIVKATRHEECPPDERYIREVIALTTSNRMYVNSCITLIGRRLSKTQNWVVALKSLMLIHRLLVDGDLAFEQEVFFATRRGTRLLNLADFRDTSGRTNAWEYSAFVRTYAVFIDEQLEFKMQDRRGTKTAFTYNPREVEEEEEAKAMVLRATPIRDLVTGVIFSRVHQFMQLLERFLACKPTGAAKNNRVVVVSLYPLLKESFKLCKDITEIMGVLIDRFMQLEIPDMMKVHEIFCIISKLFDELDVFYVWCQTTGVARSSEYPTVEKISRKKLDTMDEYIHEKAAMLQSKKLEIIEPEVPESAEETTQAEPDRDTIKALPPPESYVEEPVKEEREEPKAEEKKTQEVGDLLGLGEATTNSEDYGDKFALALFDGAPLTTGQVSVTPWEAFSDSSGDWETTLVQSQSHLSNQKPSLPGGFDPLMLDGMYRQGMTAASSSLMTTGSASSVLSAGRPEILALPAPPMTNIGTVSVSINADPFAASLGIAPPTYVQMSELERKQRLLVQEQMMWQQYTRDGRQGHAQIVRTQQQNPYQYSTGGFTRTY